MVILRGTARLAATIVFSFTMIGVAGLVRAEKHTAPDNAVYEQTCRHYENRARFQLREEGASLEVVLAASCASALQSLQGPDRTPTLDRARAAIFLDHLNRLKDKIVELSVANARAPQGTGTIDRSRHWRTIQAVSGAGEYLIAREMGVISAFEHWASSSGFTIAAKQ